MAEALTPDGWIIAAMMISNLLKLLLEEYDGLESVLEASSRGGIQSAVFLQGCAQVDGQRLRRSNYSTLHQIS